MRDMMRLARGLVVVMLLPMVFVGPAMAEDLSLPLPGLEGDYIFAGLETDPVRERSTTFLFPPEVESLQGLRMGLAGDWNVGIMEVRRTVDGIVHVDTMNFAPVLSLTLSTPEGLSATYVAEFFLWHPTLPGSTEFVPQDTVEFSSLIGEMVTAEMHLVGEFGPNETPIADSYGTLTEVRLDIDGAVPAETQTWGKVKAIYR